MAGHRSRYSDDQLGAAIFSELERQTEPCSVSVLCKTQPGLQPYAERVKVILDNMCSSEIVVRVGENYMLIDKWTASLARRSLDTPDISIDGPPQRAPAGPVTVHERPAPPSASRAVVPVQQMSVTSSCDPEQSRVNTDIFKKVMTAFRSQEPIKAKDVAQLAGLGKSRSDVNRYLYCLKNHGILSMNDKAQWSLVRNPAGDELVVFGAELAKKPVGKPKSSASHPSSSLGTQPPCSCPNAGPGCVHMTNIQQISNHYNIQVGDHSQMHINLPQDPRR